MTRVRGVLIGAVVLLIALGALASRPVLWWYNLQRAGAALSQGLEWPTPRRADSLPIATDPAALQTALGHLAAAARWMPDSARPHRLAMYAYAAELDWVRATESAEAALARTPADRTLAFEAGLMYQQLGIFRDTAPRTDAQETMRAGVLNAPGSLIRSIFCNETGAQSCYIGSATYTLPDATYPERGGITRNVIFLHPPAELTQRITIPAERPVLLFAVALDPVAYDWASNGADMRVVVQDASGTRHPVASLPISAAQARTGWLHGQADLSVWAGQQVLLSLISGAGPEGDPTDDWYGWGDLSFTSAAAARAEQLQPNRRAADIWRAAGFTETDFRGRASEPGTSDVELSNWFARAEILEDNP